MDGPNKQEKKTINTLGKLVPYPPPPGFLIECGISEFRSVMDMALQSLNVCGCCSQVVRGIERVSWGWGG